MFCINLLAQGRQVLMELGINSHKVLLICGRRIPKGLSYLRLAKRNIFHNLLLIQNHFFISMVFQGLLYQIVRALQMLFLGDNYSDLWTFDRVLALPVKEQPHSLR
jgi:hypothetical protein